MRSRPPQPRRACAPFTVSDAIGRAEAEREAREDARHEAAEPPPRGPGNSTCP